MSHLNQEYWQSRYQDKDTPWDTGAITPPIKNFIDQIEDKNLRILIPGAGRAYAAHYLFKNGFKNVYVCDWAPEALAEISLQNPDFPLDHLICEDFFKLELTVDLILEQTFFCAISPELRPAYVHKTAALLQDQGVIAGLLFAHEFPFAGPPFGGTEEEYRRLFSPYFNIAQMQISTDSIQPRAGRELFVKMIKT